MTTSRQGSERQVTDFDHTDPEYTRSALTIEADLRSRCPVAWTDSNGGFWTVASHTLVGSALRDRELCSSRKVVHPDGSAEGGVMIPPNPGYRLVPQEMDPPEWDAYRRLLARVFAPANINALRPLIESHATRVIDDVIETGQADFVTDVSGPLTALVTLDIVGLPLEDYAFYARTFHVLPHAPFAAETRQGLADVHERLAFAVENPEAFQEGKIIASLREATIDGQPLDTETMVDMIFLLLGGGFDTTSALLAHAIYYLAEHRSDHSRLLEDDHFMQTAIEELLRWVTPVVSQARTATRDADLGGQRVEAGDRMLLMFRSANHDPEVFADPDAIDLTRWPNPHFAFGSGIHRCLGSNLARSEIETVLRQVLTRMPDFQVDRASTKESHNRGTVNGWHSMPIRFTPGPRLGQGA